MPLNTSPFATGNNFRLPLSLNFCLSGRSPPRMYDAWTISAAARSWYRINRSFLAYVAHVSNGSWGKLGSGVDETHPWWSNRSTTELHTAGPLRKPGRKGQAVYSPKLLELNCLTTLQNAQVCLSVSSCMISSLIRGHSRTKALEPAQLCCLAWETASPNQQQALKPWQWSEQPA